MESTFYTVTVDENLDFPEVEDIAYKFAEVYDKFGRPDPDGDRDKYRELLPEMLQEVSDQLMIQYLYCSLNVLIFTDGGLEDSQAIVDKIRETHLTTHQIKLVE